MNTTNTATEHDRSDQIVKTVADILAKRGHVATYEYPGFIYIADNDGSTCWATGDINDTWTVDHQTADVSETLSTFDTYITTDCPDPEVIADAIERGLAKAGAQTKEI